jgi:hypothetical protein
MWKEWVIHKSEKYLGYGVSFCPYRVLHKSSLFHIFPIVAVNSITNFVGQTIYVYADIPSS